MSLRYLEPPPLNGEAYCSNVYGEVTPAAEAHQRAEQLSRLGLKEAASVASSVETINSQKALTYFPVLFDGEVKDDLYAGTTGKAETRPITDEAMAAMPTDTLEKLSSVAEWQEIFSRRSLMVLRRYIDYADQSRGVRLEFLLVGYTSGSRQAGSHLIARWGESMPLLNDLHSARVLAEKAAFDKAQQRADEETVNVYQQHARWAKLEHTLRRLAPWPLYGCVIATIVGAFMYFILHIEFWWFLGAIVSGTAAMITMATIRSKKGQGQLTYEPRDVDVASYRDAHARLTATKG